MTKTQTQYIYGLLGRCYHDEADATPFRVGGKPEICLECGFALYEAHRFNQEINGNDFFALVGVLDDIALSSIEGKLINEYPHLLLWKMQQPDFIERFCIEVCKMKGVE